MNQIPLDFGIPAAYPEFDKFLGRANAELIHTLRQKHEPFVYIWGPPGCGKSHILQAWSGQAAADGSTARYSDDGNLSPDDEADALAVDNVQTLPPAAQTALFDIFNHMRNSGHGRLLLAADVPPAALPLREDLRTRMGYCLVYEVKPLGSGEKIAALTHMAAARSLKIDPQIFHYLLDHWHRDMDSLVAMFNDLADYSITLKRPITLPLLRQLLKQQEHGPESQT